MKLLKIERFGDEVQGVNLYGDPKIQPEPTHFRVHLPGGNVDITRVDGGYWIHVHVNSEEDVKIGEAPFAGQITDARLDIRSKLSYETNTGDFEHPDLYHLAVRVGRK